MFRQRDDAGVGRGGAPTVIGRRLAVTGDLTADDPIEVHGWVEGTVVAPHVLIAPGGRVEGAVVARKIEIGGIMAGKAEALSVTIRAGAEVLGSVVHHEIEVERGAKVDGPMPWRPRGYFDDAPPPLGTGTGAPVPGRDAPPRR